MRSDSRLKIIQVSIWIYVFVQLIKNEIFNNLTYEGKIWYWSIVAQHGIIKIVLFQKGLTNPVFNWSETEKKRYR